MLGLVRFEIEFESSLSVIVVVVGSLYNLYGECIGHIEDGMNGMHCNSNSI